MPLGAVAPVQTRDAIAMREAQTCGLVVADQVALECDLSFVGLAERAGEPVVAGAWEALEAIWGEGCVLGCRVSTRSGHLAPNPDRSLQTRRE